MQTLNSGFDRIGAAAALKMIAALPAEDREQICGICGWDGAFQLCAEPEAEADTIARLRQAIVSRWKAVP